MKNVVLVFLFLVTSTFIGFSQVLQRGEKAFNIADLSRLSRNIPDGHSIEVENYAVRGDGGGGLFKYVANSTRDTMYGMVYKPSWVTGAGRLERVVDGLPYFDLNWVGIKGADTLFPVKMRKLLAWLPSNTTINLTDGKNPYLLDSAVEFNKKNTNLVSFCNATIKTTKKFMTQLIFKADSCDVRGITFFQSGYADEGVFPYGYGACIMYYGAGGAVVEQCRFYGVSTNRTASVKISERGKTVSGAAVYVSKGYDVKVYDNYFEECRTAVNVDGYQNLTSDTGRVTRPIIERNTSKNCFIFANLDYIDITAGRLANPGRIAYNEIFKTPDFNPSENLAIKITAKMAPYGVDIIGNKIEYYNTGVGLLDGSWRCNISMNQFNNCYNGISGYSPTSSNTTTIRYANIFNNQFRACRSDAIFLTGCYSWNISMNTFYNNVWAISLDDTHAINIGDNEMYSHLAGGIKIKKDEGSKIDNNYIIGSGLNAGSDSAGIVVLGQIKGVKISNNVFDYPQAADYNATAPPGAQKYAIKLYGNYYTSIVGANAGTFENNYIGRCGVVDSMTWADGGLNHINTTNRSNTVNGWLFRYNSNQGSKKWLYNDTDTLPMSGTWFPGDVLIRPNPDSSHWGWVRTKTGNWARLNSEGPFRRLGNIVYNSPQDTLSLNFGTGNFFAPIMAGKSLGILSSGSNGIMIRRPDANPVSGNRISFQSYQNGSGTPFTIATIGVEGFSDTTASNATNTFGIQNFYKGTLARYFAINGNKVEIAGNIRYGNVVRSSAASLKIDDAPVIIHTGSSPASWDFTALAGRGNMPQLVINEGTGVLTLNTAGTDKFMLGTSATSTFNLGAGESGYVISNSLYFNVAKLGGSSSGGSQNISQVLANGNIIDSLGSINGLVFKRDAGANPFYDNRMFIGWSPIDTTKAVFSVNGNKTLDIRSEGTVKLSGYSTIISSSNDFHTQGGTYYLENATLRIPNIAGVSGHNYILAWNNTTGDVAYQSKSSLFDEAPEQTFIMRNTNATGISRLFSNETNKVSLAKDVNGYGILQEMTSDSAVKTSVDTFKIATKERVQQVADSLQAVNSAVASAFANGKMTSLQFKRLFYRQAISSAGSGSFTVDVDNGGQVGLSLTTSTGTRTILFSHLNTGDLVKMVIDNSSGGAITLVVPTNSYLQGTGATATITIPAGKSMLSLADFDGGNYLFTLSTF